MRPNRKVLVAAAVLLNAPAVLSSDILSYGLTNLDLTLSGYSGCDCDDCMSHYLSWSRPFWRPPFRGCCAGRVADQDLYSLLFILSLPLIITALVPGKRTRAGNMCTCGYSRDGLTDMTVCPECGTLPPTDDTPQYGEA